MDVPQAVVLLPVKIMMLERRHRMNQSVRPGLRLGALDDARPAHPGVGVPIRVAADVARINIQQVPVHFRALRAAGGPIDHIGSAGEKKGRGGQKQGDEAVHKLVPSLPHPRFPFHLSFSGCWPAGRDCRA